ncbi:MAG: lytic transglycosylase domain-containing protein [Treponema sp.]|jgi:soluble lytic murein transglycosylase-like protein|nr:lytic transglycosylase domain-containing protein [Treponema sp.]
MTGDSKTVFFHNCETTAPLFAGTLLSLILCALVSVPVNSILNPPVDREIAGDEPVRVSPFAAVSPEIFIEKQDRADIVLAAWQDYSNRNHVLEFFSSLCGSPETAQVILVNAEYFDISPSLAFALCWEESRYKPTAVNRRNNDHSIDRGLFQLNSRSFPKLSEEDIFKPGVNARYGLGHLRWCLDTGGSELVALAMYNAGTGRVNSGGTPRRTLDYAVRILENRSRIEARFREVMDLFNAPARGDEEFIASNDSLAMKN